MRCDEPLVRRAQESEPDALTTSAQAETEAYCLLVLGHPELCCDNCPLCREMYAHAGEG